MLVWRDTVFQWFDPNYGMTLEAFEVGRPRTIGFVTILMDFETKLAIAYHRHQDKELAPSRRNL